MADGFTNALSNRLFSGLSTVSCEPFAPACWIIFSKRLTERCICRQIKKNGNNPRPLLKQLTLRLLIWKTSAGETAPGCDELRQYIIDGGECTRRSLWRQPGCGGNWQLPTLCFSINTPYMTSWYGMARVTRHMVTKFYRQKEMNFSYKQGSTRGWAVFPKKRKRICIFGVDTSTSISAALGMAMAAKYKGEQDRKVVAIIGDGAMTTGLHLKEWTCRSGWCRYAHHPER